MWLRRLWKGCRQYTRNVPGERHFYVARYAVMCHPPDFALIGRLPSNAADAECLNPLDFLSATMKPGRNGMSLDWTQRDLREGLRCFHSGAFFEAHEHWESVWLAAQEPEKTFLQGLIQVAASFHHFQRGNLARTVSLLRSALRRLEVYPEAFAGVAVDPLRATIRLWLDALGTPTRSLVPPLPQLQIASTGSISSNPASG